MRSGDNALYYSKYNGGGPGRRGRSSAGLGDEPDRVSDSVGVSVLFLGFDRALRTFRFTGGSWGSEQVIGGVYAPVRGGG